MFGAFKLLAGDFNVKQEAVFAHGAFVMPTPGSWFKADYTLDKVSSVEQVSAETAHTLGRRAGWGIAGALVAGPLSAVAAGMMGGQ